MLFKASRIHFPSQDPLDSSADIFVETWRDENGDVQIRITNNEDCLITRLTISGGGVERVWHPGTDGDDDNPEIILKRRKRWDSITAL